MLSEQIYLKDLPAFSIDYLNTSNREQLQAGLSAYLEVLYTGKGQGSFNRAGQGLGEASSMIHQKILMLDRGVYALSLLLPGVPEPSRQLGLLHLVQASKQAFTLLSREEERLVLGKLWEELPETRKFMLLMRIRELGLNKSRIRRFFLKQVLSDNRLEYWAVKYRHKLRNALKHFWGQRTTSIIREILTKKPRDLKSPEQAILGSHIDKYVANTFDVAKVRAILKFLWTGTAEPELRYCRSFVEAKVDLNKGLHLPLEILEGIRSVYHPNCKQENIQKLIQNRRRRARLRQKNQQSLNYYWDLEGFPAEQLYRWAYAKGMNADIREALSNKAQALANSLPWYLGNIGILVDNSHSMMGRPGQDMGPISMALAVKDCLSAIARESLIVYTSPVIREEKIDLIPCRGDSCIADKFLGMIEHAPEMIFIISDGFENAPAGRTGELLKAIRSLRISTPVIQINPVWKADKCSLKRLSPQIPCIHSQGMQECMNGIQKILMEWDFEKGLMALLGGVWNNIQDTLTTHNPKRKQEPYAYL